MQAQAQALVESLVADPRGEGTRRLLRGVGIMCLVLAGLLGSAAAIWLVGLAAISGWQTSDWTPLERGSLIPLPFLAFLFAVVLIAASPRPRLRRVRPLLDAIAGGDEGLAPPAVIQPEATAADLRALPALRFKRVRALEGSDGRGRAALGLLVIPLQLGPVFADALSPLLGIVTGTQVFGMSLSALVDDCMLAGGTLFVVIIIVMLLRSRRHLLVTADDFSVSWRRRGILHRTHTAHWSAARSFACVTYSTSASMRTAYMLDFDDAILAWERVPGARAAELEQGERLAGLAASRTHLPLRDLSALTVALRDGRSHPESLQRFNLAPDVLDGLRTVGRWSRGMLWLLLPATLLFALGCAIPFVATQRLEDYQRSYYTALPQQIHAEAPTYYDPLIVFDNRWGLERPTKDNGQVSIGYRNGTYQMTGQSGCYVYSYPDPVYGDAAIEVTAVQQGKAPDGNDGVGIMLRADTDQDMMVYYVSPTNRSWSLYHRRYNALHPDDSWIYIDGGTSGYLHTGAGASNTLLVIARAQTYLLYINGHFLGAAHADLYPRDLNPPASGHAGLYVNDGATTGIFSNFNVYPVQSAPSLSYVPGAQFPMSLPFHP